MTKNSKLKTKPLSISKDFMQSLIIHGIIIVLIIAFGVVNNEFFIKTLEKPAVKPIAQTTTPNSTAPIVKASLIDKKMVAQAVKRQETQAKATIAKEQKIHQQQQEVSKLKKLAEQELQKAKAEQQKIQQHKDKLQKEQQKINKAAEQLKQQEQLLKQQQEQEKKNSIATNNLEQASKVQQEISNYHARWYTEIVNNRKSSMLFPEQLTCSIKIKILPSGQISLVKVEQSSGNALYDSFAEQAIYKSAPFTMPEDPKISQELAALEYVFKFDGSAFSNN